MKPGKPNLGMMFMWKTCGNNDCYDAVQKSEFYRVVIYDKTKVGQRERIWHKTVPLHI